MEKKTLYWIRGNKNNPDGVRKALEQKGIKTADKDGNEIYAFDKDYFIFWGCDGSEVTVTLEGPADHDIVTSCGEELQPIEANKSPQHELKPFDRVLVRDEDEQNWGINLFESIIPNSERCICLVGIWEQCIPYEGNEHLLGTIYKPKE